MFQPPEVVRRVPRLAWQGGFWCAWLVATVLMLLPASSLPSVDVWDKLEHAITFAGLMLLGLFAFSHRLGVAQLALCLVAYGVAIECLQFFIPSRSFSVLDMLADSTGILLVYAVAIRREVP